MKKLLRPTLVRRIVLALLIGFPLAWVALTARALLIMRQQQETVRKDFAASPVGLQIQDALSTVDDPAEARIVGAALDRIYDGPLWRDNAPIREVLQIRDRHDHHLVFSSPSVADQALYNNSTLRTTEVVHGKPFLVMEVDTPRWSVLWARTFMDIPWVVRVLSRDLLLAMAFAFPCLMLPAWLAISQGLRPLRRLSEKIAARGPDDMSPVGVHPKHDELKPVVAALDGLLAKLRRKIESEQAFAADAAHELRTPLAVITAQAHVLAKATDEQQRADAELRLEAAISRASHLVHQLLALARMETERGRELAVVDLAQLVRKEIADFVPAALARNIEIALESPDRLLLPLEVPTFESVLQNLIDNAIRYGREAGRIVVELRSLHGAITLSVADDGPGIADSDRLRIFDRFYRGAQRNDAPGTGLGLTIVKQAAARLGGQVRITSGLDGLGCCFTVEISDIPFQSDAHPGTKTSGKLARL
jgi:two-component system, OmpR family, sensor histidine kinase QseC